MAQELLVIIDSVSEKAKPVERRGRKTTGLDEDSRVARETTNASRFTLGTRRIGFFIWVKFHGFRPNRMRTMIWALKG